MKTHFSYEHISFIWIIVLICMHWFQATVGDSDMFSGPRWKGRMEQTTIPWVSRWVFLKHWIEMLNNKVKGSKRPLGRIPVCENLSSRMQEALLKYISMIYRIPFKHSGKAVEVAPRAWWPNGWRENLPSQQQPPPAKPANSKCSLNGKDKPETRQLRIWTVNLFRNVRLLSTIPIRQNKAVTWGP